MISCIVALYTLMPAYVADKRVLASAYCMNKKNVFINQNVQFMTDLQGLVDRLFACDPKHPPAITDREIIDCCKRVVPCIKQQPPLLRLRASVHDAWKTQHLCPLRSRRSRRVRRQQ